MRKTPTVDTLTLRHPQPADADGPTCAAMTHSLALQRPEDAARRAIEI